METLDEQAQVALRLFLVLVALLVSMLAVVLVVFWPEPELPDYELEVQGDDPYCARTSFHPEDARQRYCGACKRFVDDVQDLAAERRAADPTT